MKKTRSSLKHTRTAIPQLSIYATRMLPWCDSLSVTCYRERCCHSPDMWHHSQESLHQNCAWRKARWKISFKSIVYEIQGFVAAPQSLTECNENFHHVLLQLKLRFAKSVSMESVPQILELIGKTCVSWIIHLQFAMSHKRYTGCFTKISKQVGLVS